jgi:hypothetical protein
MTNPAGGTKELQEFLDKTLVASTWDAAGLSIDESVSGIIGRCQATSG